MELQKQSKRQLTLDSIIKVYIIKQSSFLHQKQFSIDSHFYIFLGVLGMIVLLQYLNYQQMKNSEFELIDFNKNTKDIQFSQVPDDIKKTVIRLLRPQTYSPQQVQQRKNIFCNLYIDPLSTFTLVWNLFYLFVFYIVELQITLSLAFGPHFFEDQLQAKSFYRPIYIIVVLYFSVDLFLNFFKGYYAFGQGKVIDDWNLIKSKYLKSQFPIDIIVLIIYTIPLIYNDYHVNFLQLVPGILLWLKKFKYQSQIIDYLQYQVTIRLIFMLVILFSDVLMIGNYGACIFIGLDILLYNHQFYGSNDAYYWLTNNTSYPFSLISGPWYYEYIYGQEFSTGTLSTLAPGPFAKNPIQAIYAVVVMILFMVIASYVGEVLIQITQTYSQQRVFHQDNIISFDNFMQLKDVQKNIRDRIHNFFELIWEVELKVQSKQQQEMVDQLPKYLKQQLLLEMGFAKSIYFLRYFANQSSLQKIISSKFQRMTVDSDTCIFQTQSIKTFNRNIYFIKQGMAKFYVNQEKLMINYSDFNPEGKIVSQKILNLSNVERILGVYEFITGQNYSICCKSIDLCLLQKLSYQSFMEIIEQSGLWEEYKELQQKVLIGRQLRLINKCCVLCLQSHMESQCPQLCLTQRVKQQTNYKKLMGKQQKRKSFHRRPHVSKKILGNQSFKKKEALSIFNLFQDLNLGKVILQINKLSQFPIQQLEQVHSYSNYFNEHNIQ